MNILRLYILTIFLMILTAAGVAAAPPLRQNERLVIGALKQIYEAQASYVRAHSPPAEFTTLETLANEGFIDPNLGRGRKFGYTFQISFNRYDTQNFYLSVVPDAYGKTGRRSFYFDGTCTIRGGDKNGGPATIDDPVFDACVPTIAYHNENFAIQGIMEMYNAQLYYLNRFGGYCVDFHQLWQMGLINPWLASGYYHGYGFQVFVASQGPGLPVILRINATPYPFPVTGFRSFFIDQTGVLRGANRGGQRADASDPRIVR